MLEAQREGQCGGSIVSRGSCVGGQRGHQKSEQAHHPGHERCLNFILSTTGSHERIFKQQDEVILIYVSRERSDFLSFSNVDFLALCPSNHCHQCGQNVHVTKHDNVLQGHAIISHRCAAGREKGEKGG